MAQTEIDVQNAEFWNELCGTHMARELGITRVSPESLQRFDEAYLRFYPYLESYVDGDTLRGRKVLEIGMGYGTLGQLLISKGCQYYGLDIAKNPVEMMRYRLSLLGQDGADRIQQGSALEIPHLDCSFDLVYSIGCLHHTGNLSRAVSEVYRVLVPGGQAMVMLYHKHALPQLVLRPSLTLRQMFNPWRRADTARRLRALNDRNTKGEAPPHTDYVSRAEARRLFHRFSRVETESRNSRSYLFLRGRPLLPREALLSNLGRVFGLDLYIRAYK